MNDKIMYGDSNGKVFENIIVWLGGGLIKILGLFSLLAPILIIDWMLGLLIEFDNSLYWKYEVGIDTGTVLGIFFFILVTVIGIIARVKSVKSENKEV